MNAIKKYWLVGLVVLVVVVLAIWALLPECRGSVPGGAPDVGVINTFCK